MRNRKPTPSRPHPPIRDEDRDAPDWGSMTPEERRYHRLRVWAYYQALPTSDHARGVQSHPEREAVLRILRLHTPPMGVD